MVDEFRCQVATQDVKYAELAQRLYTNIFPDAAKEEKLLRGKTKLNLIPDGPLWELPFQALKPNENTFLLDYYALTYAPSASVLNEIRKARRSTLQNEKKLPLLAILSPQFGDKTRNKLATDAARLGGGACKQGLKLNPLPISEKQRQELSKIYTNPRLVPGKQATEDLFKQEAEKYGRLYFYTHGILDDTAPMYSWLMLSDSGKNPLEDGQLEAREIAEMKLHADLAILAACDTARGKMRPGEGVTGLAWAFFIAGVPATVVSQWSVDAQSTEMLMLNFHRNLEEKLLIKSTNRSKAEALRQAALSVRKKMGYDHPYWWAGFIMVGPNE